MGALHHQSKELGCFRIMSIYPLLRIYYNGMNMDQLSQEVEHREPQPRTTEIRTDLPEESTEPRVQFSYPGSSNDPPCGSDEVPESVSLARFQFNNTPEEAMRLQSIWDSYEAICEGAEQNLSFQEEQGNTQIGGVELGEDLITPEISDLPEESTEPRVLEDYSCRMLAAEVVSYGGSDRVPEQPSPKATGSEDGKGSQSSIGVPVGKSSKRPLPGGEEVWKGSCREVFDTQNSEG